MLLVPPSKNGRKARRSSFVSGSGKTAAVPDALAWREKLDGPRAPKGASEWMAASAEASGRMVVDAGPYGVIDLAPLPPVESYGGRDPQLGVVWWDKASYHAEDDDGAIETSFVPAPMTGHVSLAAGPSAAPPVPAAWSQAPAPAAWPQAQAQAPAAWPQAPAAGHAQGDTSAATVWPQALSPVSGFPAANTMAPPSTWNPGESSAPQPLSPFDAAIAGPGPAVPDSPAGTRKQRRPRREATFSEEPLAAPVPARRPRALEEPSPVRERRRRRGAAPQDTVLPGRRARTRELGGTSHERRSRLRRRRTRRRLIAGAALVVIGFLATVLIQSFALSPFDIPSVSMQNTLKPGDRILVDRAGANASSIHRGDVVVFKDPGGWLPRKQDGAHDDYVVKRVIGLPGDHVSCCSTNGRILVNGTEIHEDYAVIPKGRPAAATSFDITVPAGGLWVLGDNRYDSRDSSQTQQERTKGFVPIARVIGRAVATVWPLDRLAPVDSAAATFSTIADRFCVNGAAP